MFNLTHLTLNKPPVVATESQKGPKLLDTGWDLPLLNSRDFTRVCPHTLRRHLVTKKLHSFLQESLDRCSWKLIFSNWPSSFKSSIQSSL